MPSTGPLRLLLVEDSATDADLVLLAFRRAGIGVEHERVQSARALRDALGRRTWDAVICDYSMPGFDAAAALEELRATGQDLPFLLVSGTIPDQTAVGLMRAGAHDYILKDNLARLVPATQREIKEAEERRNRRQAEIALEESRALYRSLVAHLPAAVFRKDLDGRYQFVNAQFCAARGRPEEQVLGRMDSELLAPDLAARHRADDRRVVETGEILQAEETVAVPGEGVRHVEVLKAPVRDGDGRIVGVQGFFWDITGRKKAEEARASLEAQLRQAQKMEAIGQLSGGVAHDFNNLLTIIQGHVSMMQAAPGLPADLTESVAEIAHAAERAANLTRQLLAFGRRQTLHPVDLDLNDVVAHVTRMLQRIVGEDITVHLRFSPQRVPVHADASTVEQILLNLVVNARDAMPEGGQLEIGTRVCEIDEPAAAAVPGARAGSFACLSVGDTGCGIAPEIRPRIFEPFFTTKDVGKGTGLGLATVYGIVQQHHGWIDVRSEPGRGATFLVYLPRLAGAGALPGTAAVPAGVPGGRETILLVEDEPAVRGLVRAILARLGYRILEAHSGASALKLWPEHSREVDLLLTDMVMPDHMSGRELAGRLRQDRPDLRVIYTSGYDAEISGGDLPLEEGINFIAKPFSPARLAEIVRVNLDTPAPPGGAG
jgi:two-component system, cell cycle sensor histidine kinase and response regulator CckA